MRHFSWSAIRLLARPLFHLAAKPLHYATLLITIIIVATAAVDVVVAFSVFHSDFHFFFDDDVENSFWENMKIGLRLHKYITIILCESRQKQQH